MNKQEALEKIKELKEFVENYDKKEQEMWNPHSKEWEEDECELNAFVEIEGEPLHIMITGKSYGYEEFKYYAPKPNSGMSYFRRVRK